MTTVCSAFLLSFFDDVRYRTVITHVNAYIEMAQ
jgi:hypothetical protein